MAEVATPAAWRVGAIGITLGVASGLGYAAYSLLGRSASQRGLNPWTTLFYAFRFASVFLLVLNLVPGMGPIGAAARPAELMWLGKALAGWGLLFLLAAGPTVAGFGLYNVSLVHLPSSVANLVATMEPAFTAVIAYFLLGERLSGVQFVGGLTILGGVLFQRLHENRSTSPGPRAESAPGTEGLQVPYAAVAARLPRVRWVSRKG